MLNNNSSEKLKYEIHKNEKFGRFTVAAKTIKSGELILSEKPIFIGPDWDSELCCFNCFDSSISVCRECHHIPLCQLCTSHGDSECSFLKNINIEKNFFIKNFNLILPIRCLLSMLDETKKENFQKLLEMENHLEVRRGTERWKILQKTIIDPILNLKIFDNFPIEINAELLNKICGVLDANTIDLRGPAELKEFGQPGFNLRGIYPNASLLPHTCVNNTFITIDENFLLKIYASVEIPKGAIIYNNFTSSLFNTADRQQYLKEVKYYNCNCERCIDPTELGTFMSSIQCICNKNLLHPPLMESDKWQCENCGTSFDQLQIKKILNDSTNYINYMDLDLHQMEAANVKYSKILNPHHSLVIELKQNIASILRQLSVVNPESTPRVILKRKVELCKEILQILRTLQPGISRLTGITLYEIYVPLIKLAQRDFDNKEITADELLEKLQEGERLLKESIGMLLYEPPNVPEGLLAKRSIRELKELRESITKFEKITIKEFDRNNNNINHDNKKSKQNI